MSLAQRMVSVALDEDLVTELEKAPQGLSAQVNAAVRVDIEQRRRNKLLTELLDQLDAQHGPVDEALVGRYVELLG